MRTVKGTKYSSDMDPDDRKKLRIIREDLGLSWVTFWHHVTEMLSGVKTLDDLILVKNVVKNTLSKRGGTEDDERK
jgi:hypothetical protein